MAGKQGTTKNVYAKKVTDTATMTVRFNWSDNTSSLVKVSELPKNCQSEAMLAGIRETLGNAYAGVATLSEAKSAFNQKLTLIQGGRWLANDAAANQIGMLSEALFNIASAKHKADPKQGINKATKKPWTHEEVLTQVSTYQDEKRKEMLVRPDVAAEIAQITVRRAQAAAAEKAKAAGSATVTATDDGL